MGAMAHGRGFCSRREALADMLDCSYQKMRPGGRARVKKAAIFCRAGLMGRMPQRERVMGYNECAVVVGVRVPRTVSLAGW